MKKLANIKSESELQKEMLKAMKEVSSLRQNRQIRLFRLEPTPTVAGMPDTLFIDEYGNACFVEFKYGRKAKYQAGQKGFGARHNVPSFVVHLNDEDNIVFIYDNTGLIFASVPKTVTDLADNLYKVIFKTMCEYARKELCNKPVMEMIKFQYEVLRQRIVDYLMQKPHKSMKFDNCLSTKNSTSDMNSIYFYDYLCYTECQQLVITQQEITFYDNVVTQESECVKGNLKDVILSWDTVRRDKQELELQFDILLKINRML